MLELIICWIRVVVSDINIINLGGQNHHYIFTVRASCRPFQVTKINGIYWYSYRGTTQLYPESWPMVFVSLQLLPIQV